MMDSQLMELECSEATVHPKVLQIAKQCQRCRRYRRRLIPDAGLEGNQPNLLHSF